MNTNETPLADDLLYGDAAIGQFLGLTWNRAGHLIRTNQIPCGRVGRIHVASKAALREHFARINGGQRGDAP